MDLLPRSSWPGLLGVLIVGTAHAQATPDGPSDPLHAALSEDGRFSYFAAALAEVDLDDAPEPLTVFAPTDEAFARLPEGLLERLDAPAAAEVLREIVAIHLVPEGPHEADDLPVRMPTLVADTDLVVTYTRGVLTLRPAPTDDAADAETALAARAATESRVRLGDVSMTGALVHGVDMVMLPTDLDDLLSAAEAARADGPAVVGETPDPAHSTGAPARPDDFAEQVAEVDDGPTVAVIPDGDAAVDPPAQDDARTLSIVRIEPTESAPEPDPTDTRTTTVTIDAPREAPTSEPEEPTSPPGRLVTLPPDAAPVPDPEVTEAPPDPTSDPGAGSDAPPDAPAIDLAAEVVGVAELIGRPVRDPSGAELGRVADVLISLDGGVVRAFVYERDGGALSLDAFGLGTPETVRVDATEVQIDPLDGSVVVPGGADGDGG